MVSTWAALLPAWVQIVPGDPSGFPSLDEGEAAALSLAIQEHALLLVDEADARSAARDLGVPTIGTVGILAEAHLNVLLEFDTAILALRETYFHVHRSVLDAARAQLLARQPGLLRQPQDEAT